MKSSNLGNWAIIAASRREFTAAAWLIVWAAVLDTIDGRDARYTQTGSRFGEEMDSPRARILLMKSVL